MPTRKTYKVVRRNARKGMHGGSKFGKRLRSWLGSADSFLKRSGLLSALGNEYLKTHPSSMGNVGLTVAKQLGYGRRRKVRIARRVGGSLTPIGGRFAYGRR